MIIKRRWRSVARGYGGIRLQNIRCEQPATRVMMPRAELMRHALSQALRRVHIGPKKLKLDEETRWQIAGEGAAPLRRLERVRRGSSDEAVSERLNAGGWENQ